MQTYIVPSPIYIVAEGYDILTSYRSSRYARRSLEVSISEVVVSRYRWPALPRYLRLPDLQTIISSVACLTLRRSPSDLLDCCEELRCATLHINLASPRGEP